MVRPGSSTVRRCAAISVRTVRRSKMRWTGFGTKPCRRGSRWARSLAADRSGVAVILAFMRARIAAAEDCDGEGDREQRHPARTKKTHENAAHQHSGAALRQALRAETNL